MFILGFFFNNARSVFNWATFDCNESIVSCNSLNYSSYDLISNL